MAVTDINMKTEVLISIEATRTVDGQPSPENEYSFTTLGELSEENGNYLITYNESELTGFSGSSSFLIEPSKVTFTRTGNANAQLVLEKNNKHYSYYDIIHGKMLISAVADKFAQNFNEHGGDLDVGYMLEINNQYSGYNTLNIKVEGKN